VETSVGKSKKLFQMFPENKGHGVTGNIFSTGRIMVGRTESCEFVIPVKVVSAVHAVLEVTSSGAKVYDMNSRNGTFVNGKKVIVADIKPGDTISFGNVSFIYKEYQPAPDLPPVLDSLEPESGKASVLNTLPPAPKVAEPRVEKKAETSLPQAPEPVLPPEEEVPYIVYPLSADPKADYSEYIFEDADDLYPIFKYEHGKQAVEVIILYQDKVYSVDYLPEKDATYNIVGSEPKKNEVEFPYLGKGERTPFVEVKAGNCVVHRLHSYESMHLTDNEVQESKSDRINLQGDDIVRMVNGDLEIYIRKVSSPPKVKPAPFFRRDKNLRKLLWLVLLLIFIPLAALNTFQVDKELEKDKDPERIATILYKPKLTISKKKQVQKTKQVKKKKQQTPKKKVVKKQQEKQKVVQKQPVKSVKKVTKKTPGKKTAPKKQVVKKVKKPAPKAPKVAKTKSAAKSTSKMRTARSRKAAIPSKSKGHVDVYKKFNFKSTINKLVAKGGSLKGATTSGSTSSEIGTTSIGGGVADNLKKADVGTEIGSLTGATVGKIGQSKGAEGLSAKTGMYTAGIPSETVVLGSMDPDLIRQILREHIPQFRYCYQKELDRNPGKKISDVIPLAFTIGASGHVTKAGVSGGSRLPGHVKKCVVNVLRGIQFPSPRGGGTVDVKQPMNFYPERM
jgi:pSer/pThr/pTyr-binding forkhead associated (FHA) protein